MHAAPPAGSPPTSDGSGHDREPLSQARGAELATLTAVVEQAPAFMCTLRGPDHVFELANQRYFQLIGRREIFGKTVREALPEVAGQGFFELLDEVYATGKPFEARGVPLMISRAPGQPPEERFLEFVYQPLRAPDGSITGVFVHGIDLTEHVRAESAVRESEARYRSLFTSIDQGFCVIEVLFDADGRPIDYRFLEANDAFQRQTGLVNVIGRTARELVPALEDRWFQRYGHVALTGETIRFTESADPMGRWFDVNAFRTGDPAARRVAILFKDVTETKRAEVELRDSEERLRLAVAIAQMGTFEIDLATDVVVVNEPGREIYGWAAGEPLTFTKVQSHFHPEDREMVTRLVGEAMRPGGSGEFAVEQRIIRTDGAVRWIRVRGRAMHDRVAPSGATRCVGTYLDITPQRDAERDRELLLLAERSARSEAEAASRMKDEFLATLSHELRTPLSAILGWSQILRRGNAKPETLVEGLSTIERNARAQTQIIEDLLDMSRIISGKISLDAQRINLAGVIRAAIETVRATATTKEISIVFDEATSPRQMILGDLNRLQQVFWNLLSNAIKFTPRGGVIEVHVSLVDAHWQVSVIDSGEGIRAEFLPYVFDRFRQADASTTRRHGGLGLGLAIVKQLVELHGGTVGVTSAGVGHGATFAVTLPAAADEDRTAGDPREAKGDAATASSGASFSTVVWDASSCDDLAGAKVLIVDDEPDARGLLRQLLTDCRAQVSAAANADEAMTLLRQERFDVLVSDIGMPGEDGYALLRRVRKLDAAEGGSIPAIALTAYARADDRVKAVRAGFQMHVPKPVEPAELITMVATLSGRSE